MRTRNVIVNPATTKLRNQVLDEVEVFINHLDGWDADDIKGHAVSTADEIKTLLRDYEADAIRAARKRDN